MAKRDKKPRVIQEPKAGKPKIAEVPENHDKQKVSWQFSRADLHHDRWGWHLLEHEAFVQMFLSGSLCGIESQTWAELKSGKQHHSIEVGRLCRDAQRRLEALQLDDQDEVFSLRLSGRHRVFGIREGAALKILWNDPEHEICPSTKRNT
ncbi:hypothetical protein ACK8HJ_21245 [Vreelandella titanicae]|uniref:hypothetical protein n=1 Tax=Vreelandella titanicae TaxID=664683 RepID=UPI0039874417|tara:strand:- start:613 stop:1062 length:450 start_codon:yes stop_codon:yes gene_type:complete